MKTIICLFCFLPSLAFAGPYLDMGIAKIKTDYVLKTGQYKFTKKGYEYVNDPLVGPLGFIEAGYQSDYINECKCKIVLFARHESSVSTTRDEGINMIGSYLHFTTDSK